MKKKERKNIGNAENPDLKLKPQNSNSYVSSTLQISVTLLEYVSIYKHMFESIINAL